MNDRQLRSISSHVSRKFPEVSGARPNVKRQSKSKSKSSPSTYLITYRGKSKAADGKSITRIVRVTANDSGKILKISTSRWWDFKLFLENIWATWAYEIYLPGLNWTFGRYWLAWWANHKHCKNLSDGCTWMQVQQWQMRSKESILSAWFAGQLSV